MSAWENDELLDDELLDDELLDDCDRCNGLIATGTGGLVTEDCGPGALVEHVFCDECLDSFTAWRLSRDTPALDPGPEDETPF